VRKIPGVGQLFVRLDGDDLAVQHAAPVAAKIKVMTYDGLEVVLHQPLLDQVRLRQRAPELFRRMRDFPFDDDGEGFGRGIAHGRSFPLRGSLSAAPRNVQRHGGANERLERFFIDLVGLMKIDGAYVPRSSSVADVRAHRSCIRRDRKQILHKRYVLVAIPRQTSACFSSMP
jgi:hypothetical protein